ncbi:MAG: crosslink repair DNA glycosylase YcaQ family protein [Granulosicoccaceae bacterium]
MTALNISNQTARWLWLHSQGLSAAPTGQCDAATAGSIITELGLLQQDPIRVVARAHDHILWSRRTQYRPNHLDTLMHKHRGVFEHFSHDACLLPIQILPYWQRQFGRKAKQYEQPGWREGLLNSSDQRELIDKIVNDGPLASKDFKHHEFATPASGEIWSKPAHKRTLDYLWLKGELAVSHRKNFIKYYDIATRIYPAHFLSEVISDSEQIDWLCSNALSRLGMASPGEIMRFWEACSLAETKHWCDANADQLISLRVESSIGEYTDALCFAKNETLLYTPPEPTRRLRILNPFDPALRDRNRLERLFGFEYRIEMYTPPDKRQYGYYVYPLLEFDQIIGRIEVKHDRQRNELLVDNLWLEAGVKLGKGRLRALESELERMRKFCGADCFLLNSKFVG